MISRLWLKSHPATQSHNTICQHYPTPESEYRICKSIHALISLNFNSTAIPSHLVRTQANQVQIELHQLNERAEPFSFLTIIQRTQSHLKRTRLAQHAARFNTSPLISDLDSSFLPSTVAQTASPTNGRNRYSKTTYRFYGSPLSHPSPHVHISEAKISASQPCPPCQGACQGPCLMHRDVNSKPIARMKKKFT
ncbi:hypothetical protein EYC80_009699 [Monilinia laxa]|uniref:Uncharacterized protein n=1 Tax=Monilinia laxa TaxID=61186 RepID=A0A5N6JYM9_MONLA|nr:hypothetical protein EYC80_009699 [Monilinia laxa]